MSNRLVRKYFKCQKCRDIESQLIHPNKFQIKCSKCGIFLNEIPEKEFKILKKNKNKNTGHSSNNDSPYMPSENAFKNISSVYNRPPSNQRRNQNSNDNSNNRNRFNNINNNEHQQPRNHRYQSTNHYTDMNIVNDNNNNYNNRYNNNIININNSNNESSTINNRNDNINQFRESQSRFNRNNISNQENNENNERQRNYGQGARNRERSQDPTNTSFFNNFFNNIFGGMMEMSLGIPIIFSSGNDGQPFRIYVQRQNVPQSIFDPLFLSFGSMFNNSFRDNFSSNFRSNFRGDFLNEIIRILERNQEEAARRAHPPASESALKKLKRFPLTDKYCKKNKNGNLELPSCCICLSDIEKNEETVLLPCGHMFHWNCCLSWLKGNNTCPMCRFVIKD